MWVTGHSARLSLPNENSAFATVRYVFTLFLALLLLASTVPAYGQMQLVSAGTGWVRYADTVFFTKDNGAHWSKITPKAPAVPKGSVAGPIFFRDGSEGWAVASYTEETPPTPKAMRNAKTLYAVLHTKNGGESWDWWPLTYPAQPKWIEETFAGPASIFFLDSTHGWMDMGYAGNFKSGKLLATEDGGRTWNWVGSPPPEGPLLFTSLRDGWLIGSWGGDELYGTHDGAKSWQEIKLTPPPEIGAADRPLFSMPQFQDGQIGYLTVRYIAPVGSQSHVVVYVTHSGGKSWRAIKSIPITDRAPFTFADSTLFFFTESQAGELSVKAVSATDQSQSTSPTPAQGMMDASLADRNNGWARTLHGLYATADGGRTWTKISPPPLSRSLPHVTIPAPKY